MTGKVVADEISNSPSRIFSFKTYIGGLSVVVSKQNAEHYSWGEKCDGWHLVKQNDLSVIHERVPSGASEVRHFHNKSRQFFFVLSGTATLEVNGELHHIAAFQGIEVPPGVPHQMMNQSQSDVEFIVVSQPMSHGDRVPFEEKSIMWSVSMDKQKEPSVVPNGHDGTRHAETKFC